MSTPVTEISAEVLQASVQARAEAPVDGADLAIDTPLERCCCDMPHSRHLDAAFSAGIVYVINR